MSYRNLKDKLTFLNTKVKIDNKEEYDKYSNMLANKEELPENITVVDSYDAIGNKYEIFYREANDEEIKEIIEISNAKSLKRTGDALHFFKILIILGLVFSVGTFLISLLISIL